MDIKIWENRMEGLNDEIKTAEYALIGISEDIDRLEKQINKKENNIKVLIAGEINTDTGKPKYTNETARAAQLAEECSKDQEYNDLVEVLQKTRISKKEGEIALGVVSRRFSYLKRLIELEARD